MNWPYVLIDWEWDVMNNGGNIIDTVKYANSKVIKPLMWYNSGTNWLAPTPNDRLLTTEKRAREFTWFNEIGVYGIKVDFFAGDQQDMMKYYIDILRDAAKYHLMVNFHGATIPRGWARTYPNLMTMEAVYGAEWYNNRSTLTNKAASHNTILPFTRNVIGSMDYTPVTFSNSQHPHITSYGHELALSVVFESGLQHFADRPMAYITLPSEAELLRIFIGEADKYKGKPLYEAIVHLASQKGTAGATVVRGLMGFGADSQMHTAKILRLSEDLPMIVEIVDKPERIDALLPELDHMIKEGLVTLEKVTVFAYRHNSQKSV